jgi:multidrug efflux pump
MLLLMASERAGAEKRRKLGAAVFASMLGVMLFGIFLTPVFFYVIQLLIYRGWGGNGRKERPQRVAHLPADGGQEHTSTES